MSAEAVSDWAAGSAAPRHESSARTGQDRKHQDRTRRLQAGAVLLVLLVV